MIYSNFYWHLKEIYDLFPVQYKVRSISFFESLQNLLERLKFSSWASHTICV